MFGFIGMFQGFEHSADLEYEEIVSGDGSFSAIDGLAAWKEGVSGSYLCFRLDVRTHTSMPEVRYPAEVAVFNTCKLKWTMANDVLSTAGETVDEVGRLLRIGGI